MDFISEVIKKQEEKGYTDKEVSERSGINEYTLYYVKKYRQYLTKVAYYTLCCILDIPISEDVDSIIEENIKIVGVPTTNLKIAAEMVNIEYVENLEKELAYVKALRDRFEEKNEIINNLKKELNIVKEELKVVTENVTDIEKQAYSKGVMEGFIRVEETKQIEKEQERDSELESYKEMLRKSERELSRLENTYSDLYKYVRFELNKPLDNFSIPRLLTLKEINLLKGLEEKVYRISDEIVQAIKQLERVMGSIDIKEVADEYNLTEEEVKSIIENYEGILTNDGLIYKRKEAVNKIE